MLQTPQKRMGFIIVKRNNNDNRTQDKVLFLDLILSAKDRTELSNLLTEICTPEEVSILIERLNIANALLAAMSYRKIQDKLGASSYTVARVKREIINSKRQRVVHYLKNLKVSNL